MQTIILTIVLLQVYYKEVTIITERLNLNYKSSYIWTSGRKTEVR